MVSDMVGDQLAGFVKLSARFPARLKFNTKHNDKMLNVVEACDSQLGYEHQAWNPINESRYFFFESEEDATIIKMVIGGEYIHKVFDK